MVFFDELKQIESQIGFTSGILIGALGSWVFIIFFTGMDWWVKVLSSIGEIGIVGSLILSLRQAVIARRNYLEMKKQMDEMESSMNNSKMTVTTFEPIEPIQNDMKGGNDGKKTN